MECRSLGRTGVQVSPLCPGAMMFGPAAELALSAEALDRIEQIVAAGAAINPDDNSCGAHELRRYSSEATPKALIRIAHQRPSVGMTGFEPATP